MPEKQIQKMLWLSFLRTQIKLIEIPGRSKLPECSIVRLTTKLLSVSSESPFQR